MNTKDTYWIYFSFKTYVALSKKKENVSSEIYLIKLKAPNIHVYLSFAYEYIL
jgi:hypothetical protein